MRFMKKHGFALGLILAAVVCLGISPAKAQVPPPTMEVCNSSDANCTTVPEGRGKHYLNAFKLLVGDQVAEDLALALAPITNHLTILQNQVNALQTAQQGAPTAAQVNDLTARVTQLEAAVSTLQAAIAAMQNRGLVAWWTNGDSENLTHTSPGVFTFQVARPNANYGVFFSVRDPNARCRVMNKTTTYFTIDSTCVSWLDSVSAVDNP